MTNAADHSPAPQAPEEDVTTTLYRAAIGPVSGAYYLPVFTRFEAADHAGISWNTAAALSTFNWLVFRQLWPAALAYVGAIVAVLLLVFGIGRLVFQFSDTLMMALALGFGLAAFVLPGLFGNALLHTECRKRMAAAIAAHTELKDACAQLTRQASTRRRAISLAVANAAFWMLVLYSYLQFSALGNLAVMPQGALEPGNVAVGRAVDASASASVPMMVASAPATSASQAGSAPTPVAPASAASAPAAVAPVAVASSPVASTSAAQPASAPVSAPLAAAVPASATFTPVATAPAVAAKASATPTKTAPAASKPAGKSAVTKEAEKAEKAAKAAKATKAEEKRAKAALTDTATAPKRKASATTAKASAASSDKPYFINVGLFAKPENAANAHAKLLEAQLPSVAKELKSSKMPSLTRVRVGPFSTQQEAQAAVEKIKALQLDAIIVQP